MPKLEMFSSINLLIDRIGPDGRLEVVHGGHSWIAGFERKPPLDDDLLLGQVTTEVPLLPKDYLRFLKEISNGCMLFYDIEYGQWGFEIFSLEELVEKQEYWKRIFEYKWLKDFVVFAEMRGEGNALIFDLSKPSPDTESFAIYQADPIDPVENWIKVSRSFHEWLDHLITAQGDKYWEWR